MARLEWFVWGTIHEQFYARWADWFELQDHQHVVILWVLDRHHTTLEEALFRLDRRLSLGTSQDSFDWSDLHEAALWRDKGCSGVPA